MNTAHSTRRVETLVIGGGQAGLAVGYHLMKRAMPFLIVDANQRLGDAWRKRWDSLRLFTPARYAALPGLAFPARGDEFPTKDQMAAYLENYAIHFRLPTETGIRVDKLTREGDKFVALSQGQRFESDNVVIAMSNYQVPRPPAFARDLNPHILQLHSHEYRNMRQLQDGGVLVVGVGNSGADISMEVSRRHRTWLSGKESGFIPFPIESFVGRNILVRIVRFVGHHVLSVGTPMGRKARPKMIAQPAPLIRIKPKDLLNAGVQRVPHVTGVQNGRPQLADGTVLDVTNVIWCTGFTPGFSWIDLPIFGADARPVHDRGIVSSVPGVYFVGLHYLYSMTSATITGVGRDAERVVKAIAHRNRIPLAV